METVKINIGGVITEMEKEKVSEALEAGELNIENENLVAYDTESFESFKKNLANDEYNKGKKAESEMLIKNGRDNYGLDFEGKTLENFAEAYKKKILEEANIEPAKKVDELTSDLNKMRENYSNIEEQFNQYKETVKQKETSQKKDGIFLQSIPKENLQVDSDIALIALKNKSGIDIDFDESGGIIPMKGGQPVKNPKTLEPADFGELINSELSTLGLIKKPAGGSGGGDDPGNGNTQSNYEKFEQEMIKQDIHPGSLAFSQEMQKRMKDKTLTI